MADATAPKAPVKKAPAPKAAAPVTAPAATLSIPTITLPHWTDAGSITAFAMSIITFVFGVLTMAHVTVSAGTSDNVSTAVGMIAVVIAGGVQAVNYIRVAVLHKAAINNGTPVKVHPVPAPAPKA